MLVFSPGEAWLRRNGGRPRLLPTWPASTAMCLLAARADSDNAATVIVESAVEAGRVFCISVRMQAPTVFYTVLRSQVRDHPACPPGWS
jgi:hypothetical protein